jgi:hypothetical protein
MGIAGGCRCGAVRYELRAEVQPPVYACHCHQCQRWSGSAFSLQVLVPEDELRVEGPIVIYEKVTEDRTSTQRICGLCHSRIYNTNTRRPGIAVLRAGTLDATEALDCKVHIFTAYKQAWVQLPETALQWPEAPAPDAFIAALMT